MTIKKARTPRVYLVKCPGDAKRLVRAFTPQGAIRHVIDNDYEAVVASQDALIDALAKGAKVENAGEEPTDQEELPL